MQPQRKYRVTASVEGKFSFCSDLARTNGVGGSASTRMDYAAAAVAMRTATTVRLGSRKGSLTYVVTFESTQKVVLVEV
ncbi:unnamed protein product [Closterium sp. Yama58-4]|nr:unnamed protein product [Closterium sp. Yama58-4]